MKIPLRFQITEYDCGTVALQNAFCFLFARHEIPAEIVRAIHIYTLDCYDENGNLGQGGTSEDAIERLSDWITDYANHKDFDVICNRFLGKEINEELMQSEIKAGAVLFVRCWQYCEHYVIITDIKDKFAYVWDSYYLEENYYDKDEDIQIIYNEPFFYNRKVRLSRLFSNTKKDFALLEENHREMVGIKRKS